MSYKAICRTALIMVVVLLLEGCKTGPTHRANLKKIYDKSAQYHKPDRNPIIVIPGILGSRLVDENSGTTVWGAFRRDYADPNTVDGSRLIALPFDAASSLASQVRPDGVLDSLELDFVGFPIRVQIYKGILETLGAGGYRDELLGLTSVDYGTDHYTCFQFDYDWRKDITENVAALKAFIDEKRLEVQANHEERYGIKNAEVKFDIAAHSMGSLLTRYFLQFGAAELPGDGSLPPVTWAGAQDIERVVLVAPPNAGSLEAFDQLVHGFNTGRPLLPFYHPALLGTFPSIYQLMPRSRHQAVIFGEDKNKPVEDILSPELWAKMKWGLNARDDETRDILRNLMPDVKSEKARFKLASDFQRKALNNAKQFQMAMDQQAALPQGLDIMIVAGDATPTPEIASVDASTGAMSIIQDGIGDGTVLRSSVLLDDRMGGEWGPSVNTSMDWTTLMFVFSEHREITSEPVFEDNVLYWLLEDPRQ